MKIADQIKRVVKESSKASRKLRERYTFLDREVLHLIHKYVSLGYKDGNVRLRGATDDELKEVINIIFVKNYNTKLSRLTILWARETLTKCGYLCHSKKYRNGSKVWVCSDKKVD